jgi:hypothetical protein
MHGCSAQELSVGTSRRRGPPAVAGGAPDTAAAHDIDAFRAQAEETREALRRLRRPQCGGFHRPYLILGIDWSAYIDGDEVTGFGS